MRLPAIAPISLMSLMACLGAATAALANGVSITNEDRITWWLRKATGAGDGSCRVYCGQALEPVNASTGSEDGLEADWVLAPRFVARAIRPGETLVIELHGSGDPGEGFDLCDAAGRRFGTFWVYRQPRADGAWGDTRMLYQRRAFQPVGGARPQVTARSSAPGLTLGGAPDGQANVPDAQGKAPDAQPAPPHTPPPPPTPAPSPAIPR